MQEIAKAIQEGAEAYMRRQCTLGLPVAIVSLVATNSWEARVIMGL